MSELSDVEEDERDDLEPDLAEPPEEPAVADLPEDFPVVWLLVFADGEEEVEPDFALAPVEAVRLLPDEVVFEPVLLPLVELPDDMLPEAPLLLLLVLCVPPDIIEEEELLMPDWFAPDIDLESELEAEVED